MLLPLFKALADNTRLRLIAILDRGEFTVQELVGILQMGQSRISRHLKILTEAGVISVKREGTWAYYRLDPQNSYFRSQLPELRDMFYEIEDAERDSAYVNEILAQRSDRSQKFFQQHAHEWDRLARELLPTPDYFPQLYESLPSGELLIEIGVGTGSMLRDLSCITRSVIGVDHSPAMLQAAGERVASDGLGNIDLRLGEMEHLPVENNVADVVLLHMVLHHAASPEAVIAEVQRVLRASGRVFIVDLLRHRHEWVRERLADQWLGFECSELEQWCRTCGLNDIRYQVTEGTSGQSSVVQLEAVKTG